MDATKFATWKYQHTGAGFRNPKQRIFAAILLLGALIAQFRFHALPASIPLCIMGLIAFFYSAKKIFLGPRYLICGSSIVYYNNVVRLALDEDAGNLLLVTAADQSFTLERDKFPTGARKADKIIKNKAAKFTKVSQNLIGKVLRASPGVQTTGISGMPMLG
jgi:hypothetical protein